MDDSPAKQPHQLMETLLRLQHEIEAIGMRGLRAMSQEQIVWLTHYRESIAAAGAEFMAAKIQDFLDAVQREPALAASRFLELLTALRVLERVLTLETVANQLEVSQ